MDIWIYLCYGREGSAKEGSLTLEASIQHWRDMNIRKYPKFKYQYVTDVPFIILKILNLFKNFQFCSISRKAKILTGGILRVCRGLKFESDTEIGQKGVFLKWFRECLWASLPSPFLQAHSHRPAGGQHRS